MSLVEIRDAVPEDASTLCNAEIQIARTPGLLVSRPHEPKLENFIQKIRTLSEIPNGKYIVALKANQIVGHALLDPMGLEAVSHILRLTIAVHPGHEENGIGEALMRHLIGWAEETSGVEKIELNVRATNIRAIHLYQKLGFFIESRLKQRMKFTDGTYVDDLEMGLFVKGQQVLAPVVSQPIGKVISSRKEVIDDDWDGVESSIHLDSSQFDATALNGLDTFSHIEVIFHMNQVDVRKIETSARHPRNNPAWPEVGIFAQRGKNRPNQLGLTICKLLKVEGLRIDVKGLDAVDGTSVLDIKPWVKEFGPRGELKQPKWISELMHGYWSSERNLNERT